MATHSSVLAWRIPGTGKPGGLPSMGLHRVGHNWSDLAAAAAAASVNVFPGGSVGKELACNVGDPLEKVQLIHLTVPRQREMKAWAYGIVSPSLCEHTSCGEHNMRDVSLLTLSWAGLPVPLLTWTFHPTECGSRCSQMPCTFHAARPPWIMETQNTGIVKVIWALANFCLICWP